MIFDFKALSVIQGLVHFSFVENNNRSLDQISHLLFKNNFYLKHEIKY